MKSTLAIPFIPKIEIIDSKVETLSRDDKRFLKNFIRNNHEPHHDYSEYIEKYKDVMGVEEKKFFDQYLRLVKIYSSLGIIKRDFDYYWGYYKSKQWHLNNSYSHNASKPPRQDNKTYLNTGSANCNRNKIRFPKKVRKTAWKRFYKLFPHLKPENQLQNG